MINKLHEMSFRIIPNDYSSDFTMLLENNNDICNHRRNIQAEIFKLVKWILQTEKRIFPSSNGVNFRIRDLILITWRTFKRLRRKEKESFDMVLKSSVTVILDSGRFCRKVNIVKIFKPIQKKYWALDMQWLSLQVV